MTKNVPTQSTGKKIGIALGVIIILGVFSLIAAAIIGVFVSSSEFTTSGNVAVIKLNGILLTDSPNSLLGPSVASSTQLVEFIKKADSNKEIKAIY